MLAAIALALPAAAAAQDAPATEGPMVGTTAQERGGQIASDENFTGTVYVEPVFDARDPFIVNAGKVTFLPGARSNWHSHPAGQMLIVTDGTGWVATRDGQRIVMNVGDVIWTPPVVEHWHGATDGSAVSHYAVQQYENGENVVWLEPVTDAAYRGG
ncbi:cupin domain-containing protein [Erythrobacter sp. 3-20A1M]|nr:cupin domain-containing protein [Erythrobacter sp. 3-20A1M]